MCSSSLFSRYWDYVHATRAWSIDKLRTNKYLLAKANYDQEKEKEKEREKEEKEKEKGEKGKVNGKEKVGEKNGEKGGEKVGEKGKEKEKKKNVLFIPPIPHMEAEELIIR